uniref:Uncharacterized protein n=1 Tax=Anguilla anguilla TaxID=7936 RepID=A0A0E9Q9Z3_ANGAN
MKSIQSLRVGSVF